MRTSTKNIVSAIGLGTLAASYIVGMNSTAAAGFSAAGLNDGSGAVTSTTPSASTSTAAAAPSSSASSSASASSTKKAASSSSTKKSTATKKSTGSSSSSSGSSSASSSKPSSSASSSSSAPAAPAAVTKSGSAVSYQFGTVQVSVTKTSGKITSINLLQAGATHGREGAFSYLVQAAMSAQGSGFGNISGATYTTEAFKQALDSALGKF